MSMEKQYGRYTPVCDVCYDELETSSDFLSAVQSKRDNDWKTKKVNGEWIDICPVCQEESLK